MSPARQPVVFAVKMRQSPTRERLRIHQPVIVNKS
jgi:hypothetical protein